MKRGVWKKWGGLGARDQGTADCEEAGRLRDAARREDSAYHDGDPGVGRGVVGSWGGFN